MKNATSRILLLVLFSAAGAAANAANTAQITVTGKIVPPACDVTVGKGGNFDYGQISNASLSPTTATLLPELSLPLQIDCAAAGRVMISMADQRADSVMAAPVSFVGVGNMKSLEFGLGTVASKKTGAYILYMKPSGMTVDGSETNLGESRDKGVSWNEYSTANFYFEPTSANYGAWIKPGTATPKIGSKFTGNLYVQAAINRKADLDLSSEVKLDGLATLTVYYL